MIEMIAVTEEDEKFWFSLDEHLFFDGTGCEQPQEVVMMKVLRGE